LLAESQQLMDEYDQLAEDYENLMNEVNRWPVHSLTWISIL
jgi:hypothetical protein